MRTEERFFDEEYFYGKIEEHGYEYIASKMGQFKKKIGNNFFFVKNLVAVCVKDADGCIRNFNQRDYLRLAYVLSLAKWAYVRDCDPEYGAEHDTCGLCIYQGHDGIESTSCEGCSLNDFKVCCVEIRSGSPSSIYNRLKKEYEAEFAEELGLNKSLNIIKKLREENEELRSERDNLIKEHIKELKAANLFTKCPKCDV